MAGLRRPGVFLPFQRVATTTELRLTAGIRGRCFGQRASVGVPAGQPGNLATAQPENRRLLLEGSGRVTHDQSAQRASVIVALPAVIDLGCQHRAYEQLYAAVADRASVVIADLTAATWCDCSSLRRLVAIQHLAAARGGQLRLAITPGSPVHHMAQLMDLDHLLPIYPSVVQAAAAGPLPHLNEPGLRHPAAGTAVVADITELIGADLLRISRWQAQFGEIRRRRRDPASRPALATAWDTLVRLIDLHMRA